MWPAGWCCCRMGFRCSARASRPASPSSPICFSSGRPAIRARCGRKSAAPFVVAGHRGAVLYFLAAGSSAARRIEAARLLDGRHRGGVVRGQPDDLFRPQGVVVLFADRAGLGIAGRRHGRQSVYRAPTLRAATIFATGQPARRDRPYRHHRRRGRAQAGQPVSRRLCLAAGRRRRIDDPGAEFGREPGAAGQPADGSGSV